jgi:general secretion pathway protein D
VAVIKGLKPESQKVEEQNKAKAKAELEKDKKQDEAAKKEGDTLKAKKRVKKEAKADANDPNVLQDPNDPLVAVNLKDVEMKDIITKLSDWTDKVVIPADDKVMKEKITIYAGRKLPRSKALSLIYSALRTRGFMAEETDDVIYLKSVKDAKFGTVPIISAEESLAVIENKNLIVQKFFRLENYNPAQLQQIILPLIPEHGYVSSDESTGQLVVIDTVSNLMRIERIIAQLDIPQAQETVTRTFEIQAGDPVEIVQLLRILLTGQESGSKRGGKSSSSTKKKEPGKGGGPATSVMIGPSDSPIVLIPITKRNWIIAKCSADNMQLVEEWIKKLDHKKPEQREYTLRKIEYVDVRELAERLNEMLEQMPGQQLKANVMVQPLTKAKQLMIVGSKENREMLQQLIDEIDIPTDKFLTEHIKLKYADPEVIQKNVQDLYMEFSQYESSSRYGRYRSKYYHSGSPGDPDLVRVIAYPALKQVTVIASADNMEKVKEQIKEWDKPIDVNEVAPLIIELKNSDPVQMADLLGRLFSEIEQGGRSSFYDMFFGGSSRADKKKIVGPLYGKLTFEAVPDTKKIVVISKVPEAYEVIKKLVFELDRQEMAEVPVIIILNYADPEDVAERLNATFNEAGTMAKIRRSDYGLSDYSMEEEDSKKGDSQNESTSRGEYQPPWTSGRTKADEMPISNVIGRIRFMPDPRTKAILVLAPPEFIENIRAMIKELDRPGKQVMIKAIVLEVEHSNMTSLGLQLSSDVTSFGTIGEDAITALTQLSLLDTRGSLALDTTANISTLIDFLIKKTDAKILNQQTLWTKDNEEANFFKGSTVPFIEDSSTSTEGGRLTQTFTYERVGMTLRIRPNITPENNVNMTINMIMSQLGSELINGQPVRTEMDTTTNLIVQDGQTIMLGGILFQEDSKVERKLPLIGDLPLVGAIFRHYDVVESNNEMIIFITPNVIDREAMLPETEEELKKAERKLKAALKEFQGAEKSDNSDKND